MTAVDLEVLLLPFMGQPHRSDEAHISSSLASACGALFAMSIRIDGRCLRDGESSQA